MSLADRLAGAVWGHLIGDAVGVPYEFRASMAAQDVRFGASGSHHQPPGIWSDDGALMLALLDSLLDKDFDTTDQATRALAWYRDGAYTPDHDGRFDSGGATADALMAFELGTSAESAGRTDEMACGNGSLMRILPLSLVERDLPAATLVEHAHKASSVTHGHHRPQVACALYVLVARGLLTGRRERERVLAEAKAELRGLYGSGSFAPEYLAALDELEGWTGRSGRTYVLDSFWSAWDAFVGADSYTETIKRAVAYGKDTDTTAAIAGGLAGIHWGIDGIPADWLNGMRGKDVVRPLVAKLVDQAGYNTSDLRVQWVDTKRVPGLIGASGKLGMTFLPGKRYPGRRRDHWRDLDTDVAALQAKHGVGTFLLLVEDHELDAARVGRIAEAMSSADIELIRFPIVDGGVPTDVGAFRATLFSVMDRLRAGSNVAVACMGGLGRTGLTVACLLREAGLHWDDAVIYTRMAREGTIETAAQLAFVENWQPE